MKAIYCALSLALLACTTPLSAASGSKTSVNTPSSVTQTKINLNTAELSTLTGSFKGIGKKRAEAIIAYRESHHGFKSIEELASVKGFSQRFLDANKDKLKTIFTVNVIAHPPMVD